MTATQAYRAYLGTQGQARLSDTPPPFLVRALDEELPDVQDVSFIHVSGRTSTLWCVFRIPETFFYYTIVISDELIDVRESETREVHVSSVMPHTEGLWIVKQMQTHAWHTAPVAHFGKLKEWTLEAPPPVAKDVSSCVIV